MADKQQESNDLRALNRQLQAQNQQLTQLTQTLLRHPAFSSFLEDTSNDPTIIAPPEEQQNGQIDEPEEQHREEPIKEEQDSQQQHQEQHQHQHQVEVNMTTVPPTRLDLSMLNLGSNHWGGNQGRAAFSAVSSLLRYRSADGTICGRAKTKKQQRLGCLH